MSTYNGYKNWNHWNVSLWINNDERLYRMASHLTCQFKKDTAARVMMETLSEDKITHTPDGAPYSKSAIRSAMVGM